MSCKKINITIDEDLLLQFDEFSKLHHLSRSGFLALAGESYIRSVEYAKSTRSLVDSVQVAFDSFNKGQITLDEVQDKLLDASKESKKIAADVNLL